tara:strand:+ start:113 stop:445 length:333 start_codon:yes stop_codon:yes gene_type:complete
MERLNLWALVISAVVIIAVAGYHFMKIVPVMVANDGYENHRNIREVSLGMTKRQMLTIMGEPDTIRNGVFFNAAESSEVYQYENSLFTSEDILIIIDSTDAVTSIIGSNK